MTGSRLRDQFLAAMCALTGLVIVADQVAIVLVQILPANPGVIGWRYGAVGLTVGRATPMLLADLLLILAALCSGHRMAVRLVAALHFLLVPVLLAVLGAFVLDAIQIVGGMPPSQLVQTRAGAVRAAGMLLVLTGFAAWGGWLLWRHASSLRGEPRPAAVRSVLVVGTETRESTGGHGH